MPRPGHRPGPARAYRCGVVPGQHFRVDGVQVETSSELFFNIVPKFRCVKFLQLAVIAAIALWVEINPARDV